MVAAVLTVIDDVGEIAADVLEEIVGMLIEMGRIAIDEVPAVLTRPLPEIPFLTELYRSRPGKGRSLNLMGITALAGSFPLAVLYRAQTGNRSFPGVAALTRQDSTTVISSVLYAGMKYFQSLVSAILMYDDVKRPAPALRSMTFVALIDLVIGIGLHIQGNPVPPGSDRMLDLKHGWTTPQHWPLATWELQWFPNVVIPALKVVFALGSQAAIYQLGSPPQKLTGPMRFGAPIRSLSEAWKSDPAAVVTTVVEAIVGLVHIVYFSGLAASDAAHGAELEERRRAAILAQQLSHEEELYRAWANSDGAIAAKFIGNLAGALPSCAPLAALFHPAGALVAPAANLAEAITYTARTASNAIY